MVVMKKRRCRVREEGKREGGGEKKEKIHKIRGRKHSNKLMKTVAGETTNRL